MRKSDVWIKCGLVVVIAGLVLLWQVFRPAADLTLTVLDVGQGDAILIRTRDGQDILIDGGPDDRVLEELGQVMPFYDRSIELMVLTHPHADHLAGLVSVLGHYRVGRVLSAATLHDSQLYQRWQVQLKTLGIPMLVSSPGQEFSIGIGKVSVLWAGQDFQADLNDASIVLRLDVGSHCALLMGDAGFMVEDKLMQQQVKMNCEVLKIGHHGSARATSSDFLSAVNPRISVISVGKGNRYGHPAPSTLTRLQHLGSSIWRTDEMGKFQWRCSQTGVCSYPH